jgi:DNA-binding response OmpR family regulator
VSRILIVDDDEEIVQTLSYNLESAGYRVDIARDGVAGLRLARTGSPDLVLLDLMLPGIDGVEVCRMLRKTSSVPVIMVTARSSEADKVLGLEIGADDYITKPFSIREVLARIHAVIRRTSADADRVRRLDRELIGNFELDRAARRVILDGVEVKLTNREFDLLSFLIASPERVHARDAILVNVWGAEFVGDPKTIDVHIRWLRAKFSGRVPFSIVTVRGTGYRLDLGNGARL